MIKKTKKQFAFAKNLRKVFLGFCLLATLPIFGQASFDALKGAPSTTTSAAFTKNVAIGLNVGITNGIGLDVAYRFSKHWAGKLAYNYADYSKKGYTYDIVSTNPDGTKNTQTLSFDGAIHLSRIEMFFE